MPCSARSWSYRLSKSPRSSTEQNVTPRNLKWMFGEIVLEWFSLKHEHYTHRSCFQGDINLALNNRVWLSQSIWVCLLQTCPAKGHVHSIMTCLYLYYLSYVVTDHEDRSGWIGRTECLRTYFRKDRTRCHARLRVTTPGKKIWPFIFPCSFFFFSFDLWIDSSSMCNPNKNCSHTFFV